MPIVELASAEFGLPAVLDNDATAAAAGEHRFGAGRGHAQHGLPHRLDRRRRRRRPRRTRLPRREPATAASSATSPSTGADASARAAAGAAVSRRTRPERRSRSARARRGWTVETASDVAAAARSGDAVATRGLGRDVRGARVRRRVDRERLRAGARRDRRRREPRGRAAARAGARARARARRSAPVARDARRRRGASSATRSASSARPPSRSSGCCKRSRKIGLRWLRGGVVDGSAMRKVLLLALSRRPRRPGCGGSGKSGSGGNSSTLAAEPTSERAGQTLTDLRLRPRRRHREQPRGDRDEGARAGEGEEPGGRVQPAGVPDPPRLGHAAGRHLRRPAADRDARGEGRARAARRLRRRARASTCRSTARRRSTRRRTRDKLYALPEFTNQRTLIVNLDAVQPGGPRRSPTSRRPTGTS